MLTTFPLRLTLLAMNHRSNIYRALVTNPGSGITLDQERIYSRNLEVPSGGGVGTARAIAKLYGVFASGGRELDLKQEDADPAAGIGYVYVTSQMGASLPGDPRDIALRSALDDAIRPPHIDSRAGRDAA